MRSKKVLVIDDEPDIRELLEITLNRMEIACRCVADLASAREILQRERFDLCLTDMRLPDGNGVEFLSWTLGRYPKMPVAVITAHGNMEIAIQALKSGAFDFLTKPVDLAMLRSLVRNALDASQRAKTASRELVGHSEAIDELKQTIEKLARSQAPVYISGESGVGKELVARLIHENGHRGTGPFIPVNCGAIPQDLMESEFFGHKKGSFTGANSDKQGLFQAAQGGTLFLDEVAELPAHMQVKLLRSIQEKRIRPVGDQIEVPVDVRILSATHKDLSRLVAEGAFRQDLFYRINVIEVRVPALRDRPEDIMDLVKHILAGLAQRQGGAGVGLTPEAERALTAYAFPGNVRELENILERAVTLCEGATIQLGDLRLPQAGPVDGLPSEPDESLQLDEYLSQIERRKISEALEQVRWNKTAAARKLGISFRALRYRLQKLGME